MAVMAADIDLLGNRLALAGDARDVLAASDSLRGLPGFGGWVPDGPLEVGAVAGDGARARSAGRAAREKRK
jgi:hypothetical protein